MNVAGLPVLTFLEDYVIISDRIENRSWKVFMLQLKKHTFLI